MSILFKSKGDDQEIKSIKRRDWFLLRSNGAVYRRKQNRTVEKVENTQESIGEHEHKQNRSCYRTRDIHRNTCDILTQSVVQREIVGSGRFGCCWLVPKKRGQKGHFW
jgi:hypothetical protein